MMNEGIATLSRYRYDCITHEEMLNKLIILGRAFTPNFSIDDENAFAYNNLVDWMLGREFKCLNPEKGNKTIIDGDINKGIYIAGGTGTGKTLATRILSKLCADNLLKFSSGGRDKWLFWQNIRADKIVSYFQTEGDLDLFIGWENPVLGIQDFGSEPREASYMGSKVDVMRYIVENRADDLTKLTIYTSNIALWNKDKLCEKYGDRVYDRLRGTCNYFEMIGPSRR